MASKADKENPSHHPRGARSKIPVSAKSVISGLTRKVTNEKHTGLLADRQPLCSLQATATEAGTYNDLNNVKLAKKPEQPFSSEMKKETRLTQISPKGSVYKIIKSKTITKSQNEQPQYKSLQDRVKHVTIRSRHDSPLDWNLEAFKGHCGSGDDHNLAADRATVVQDKLGPNRLAPERAVSNLVIPSQQESTSLYEKRSQSAERPSKLSKATTPTLEPLVQNNRVKNIKRSLKRPSSRELQLRTSSETDIQLQGELPAQAQAGLHAEAAPLVQKEIPLRVMEFDPNDFAPNDAEYIRKLTQSYERRIIRYLQAAGGDRDTRLCHAAAQRSLIVNWLVKVNGVQTSESGGPAVLQAAVHHLDRVLARAVVPLERLQLIAAACYWLAQKQSAKPRSAASLVRHAAYAFKPSDLRAAERYILRKLSWPRLPVVPDDFVPYLVHAVSPHRAEPLMSAASCLCACALLDAELSACAPDLLALAAVLDACRLLAVGDVARLTVCPLFRSLHDKPRLRTAMGQLMQGVLIMQDEACRCREPFAQFSRPPHCVAPRLAAAIAGSRDHS